VSGILTEESGAGGHHRAWHNFSQLLMAAINTLFKNTVIKNSKKNKTLSYRIPKLPI